MNIIQYQSPIIHIAKYEQALAIHCQDNPYPGKIVKISTYINGSDRTKWEDKLKEGDLISIKGNIAEVKQNNYGAFIIVYNPEILNAQRIKPEEITPNEYEQNETEMTL